MPIHALGLLLKNEPTRFASHPEADHRLPLISFIGSNAAMHEIAPRYLLRPPGGLTACV
jgi:hypothetical protein